MTLDTRRVPAPLKVALGAVLVKLMALLVLLVTMPNLGWTLGVVLVPLALVMAIVAAISMVCFIISDLMNTNPRRSA
ncbi:hypothetical protein GCM10025867_50670 (plasmid) [Frondihabitans sucicola]|uniref:Uncharacterized protein n=1 Tax=Frondihabitans sucicola TaxID=1268041 RepID=A0ABM8GWI4_9MICO|nr:hypothetical protein [Frondihabitans sucicola]BDZ52826.1 hypothetical protein GCM10025867_50670 [Frondihabitans sucicola]